jgi:hypothetical protein
VVIIVRKTCRLPVPDRRRMGPACRSRRGQRDKRAAEEAEAAGKAVEVIDVSDHRP